MSVKVTVPIKLTYEDVTVSQDIVIPQYDENFTYQPDEIVPYKGVLWQALKETTGVEPSLDNPVSITHWLYVSPDGKMKPFTPEWAGNYRPPLTDEQPYNSRLVIDFNEPINTVHLTGLGGVEKVVISVYDADDNLVFSSENSNIGRALRYSSFWEFFFGQRKLVDSIRFTNIPFVTKGRVDIRLFEAGSGAVTVRDIIIGRTQTFGEGVLEGADFGVDSYSKARRDSWGVPTLRKGNYSRNIRCRALVKKSEADAFADFLIESDAQVRYWDIADSLRSTKVLGFVSRWRAHLPDMSNYVIFSLDIEGMAVS